MKLAFSTLACPTWSLQEIVDNAVRYGYEGLEMRLLNGEVIQSDLSTELRHAVKQACHQAGLPIVCLDTSVSLAQTDKAEQEAQIREGLALLELAAAWETPLMRVFGRPPDGTAESAAIVAATATLQRLAERGKELGVCVVLETHDYFARGELAQKVLENVPSSGAGILWDTLHPYRMGETVEFTANVLANRLQHVHIKDGQPPAGGGTNWDLKLLGEGTVPIPAILSALQQRGYQGWLSVEWEKRWHPDIEAPEIALPQHIDLLLQYMAPKG